jgi:hypothetical protein
VRRALRTTVLLAIAGGAAAVAALLVGVDRDDLVLDAYLVYLAGVVALGAARVAAGAFPRPSGVVPRAIAQRPERSSVPDSLARIEGIAALAQADELDYHVRLRPILADIAAVGHAAATGAGDDALSESAEASFTPETWALIRPDRPRPAGPGDRGIDATSLRAVLDELESKLAP